MFAIGAGAALNFSGRSLNVRLSSRVFAGTGWQPTRAEYENVHNLVFVHV